VGEFLHIVALAGGYRRGLEIGTGAGYSALWIASALIHNGGIYVGIDHDIGRVTAARERFRKAQFGQCATVVCGDAENAVQRIDGPFDFVFVDADMQNAQRYFDLVWPKLAQRATIVMVGAAEGGDAVSRFSGELQGNQQLAGTRLKIGRGLHVAVKAEPMITSLDGADWAI
jgi:predicted O-methyltransferase YrrM